MTAAAATDDPDLPAKAETLVRHLRERVEKEGSVYVKSRFVAEEVDLSAKEIGAYMRRLQESQGGLRVEAWAYTNGTTWYVSASDDE